MMEKEPYIPTGEELAEIGGTIIDTERWVIDPTKTFEPIQFTLAQGGIGIAPRGDLHVIKAPQKNGKTFLLTLIMGAMLKGEYLGLISKVDKPKLLFIDTEQHPRNTQLAYRRICQIAGINGRQYHEQLRVLSMRGESVSTIRRVILQEVVIYKPDVVYIDGLVDCVVDPNDQAESKAYITALSGLAMRHNCSVWGVVHVNPGTDKMRGHLGTIMAQKVSDVLQCLKEKQPDGSVIFTVEQTDTRNKDINKFSFCIEDRLGADGEMLALPVATYINVKKRENLNEIMQKALEKPLRNSDLIQVLVEQNGIKKTKAYELKNDAESLGIIEQDRIHTYCYRYIGLDLQNEEKLPF